MATLVDQTIWAHFRCAASQHVVHRLSVVHELVVHVRLELHGHLHHANQYRVVDALPADQPATVAPQLCDRRARASAAIDGGLAGDSAALCAAVRATGDGGCESGAHHCPVLCE